MLHRRREALVAFIRRMVYTVFVAFEDGFHCKGYITPRQRLNAIGKDLPKQTGTTCFKRIPSTEIDAPAGEAILDGKWESFFLPMLHWQDS